MDSGSNGHTASFPPIVTAVVCIAALYFARAVLVPIALAILLAFVLSPGVTRLEKWRLGRAGPVIVVVLLSLFLLIGLGWIVGKQAIHLATQIPEYSQTLSKKIQSLGGVKNGGLGKAASTVSALGTQLSNSIESQPSRSNSAAPSGRIANNLPALPSTSQKNQPVPVEVVSERNSLRSLRSLLGPILGPIATIVIVFVFTIFMLLRRENLRDRLFTLAGLNSIRVTRKAFSEATNRVVHYLLLQSLMNLGFGVIFGIVLYFIGVPNALLWGVLAGILRFIPYVGTLIGAALPIILSFAVFDGWTRPLLTLGTYLVLEVSIGYFIEPLVYAANTGISSLAILVAAIFWAALWGPVGLLLSTPLTVCLVVMGRYIPQLEFLSVLLGDDSVLATEVQLYQSLNSMDTDQAQTIIEQYLHEKSVHELYDSVFIPVLILAERNKHDAAFASDPSPGLFRQLRRIVEDVSFRYTKDGEQVGAAPPMVATEQILPYRSPNAPEILLCCLPARDEGDEVAAMMLAHLFVRAGYDAHAVTLASHRDMLDETDEQGCQIGYISALPPFGIPSIRRLYTRIRARFPKCRIGIGLWGYTGDAGSMRNLLRIEEADLIVTSLAEAVIQVQQFTELSSRSK